MERLDPFFLLIAINFLNFNFKEIFIFAEPISFNIDLLQYESTEGNEIAEDQVAEDQVARYEIADNIIKSCYTSGKLIQYPFFILII